MRLTAPCCWLLASLALAACSAVPAPQVSTPAPQPVRPAQPRPVPPTQPPPPPVEGFRMPEIMSGPGLEGIIRQDAAALAQRFGQPRLDVREGDMRKLQFVSRACVLDVYLYPLRPNAEPVATHVEARRASDGKEVDRVACILALRTE